MWRRLTDGSRRDKLVLRRGKDLVSEVAAERRRGVQIDGPPKQLAQFLLHPEEAEAGGPTRLELDEHVNVAAGAEVVPQRRPEEGETPNAVLAAEFGKSLLIDGHLRTHRITRRIL